jgi:hypothetical protein
VAETTAWTPQPVMEDPDASPDYYDEDNEPHGPSVGWDLAWGCRVSIGYDADVPDRLTATVSMSDEDQRRGLTVRAVTPDQVRDYANHLLALVGAAGAGKTTEADHG